MAFTVSDFEDLLKLLSEHPEWRERLRPVILGEEILSLPGRMDRVEAALEQLTQEVRSLTEEQLKTAYQLTQLVERMDRLDGRMSNIEGGQLEGKYERQIGSWFAQWLKRPSLVGTDDLGLYEAQASGRISPEDRSAIEHLDLIVRGVERGSSEGELVLAVEVSHTINLHDVERAHSRAGLLQQAGHASKAFVGGYRIADDARRLADELKVIVDLRRPD